jgi:hypothetical protein
VTVRLGAGQGTSRHIVKRAAKYSGALRLGEFGNGVINRPVGCCDNNVIDLADLAGAVENQAQHGTPANQAHRLTRQAA